MAGRGVARQNLTLVLLMLATSGLASEAFADPVGPDNAKLGEDRLQPGLYPAAPVPEAFAVPDEPGHPPFNLDWSVGLKGTYTAATSGNSFVTTLTPQFSAAHEGTRLDYTIDGSAAIAKPWDGTDATVTAGQLGASGSLQLDRDTKVSGNASVGYSRDLPTTPGLDPVIVSPPGVATASFGLGAERRFGHLNVGISGDLKRTAYGSTTRIDTGVTDNSDRNLWEGDASLRLGYQVTPIFEVFTQASAGRDWFDKPSAATGISSNAGSRDIRAGVTGTWGSVLTASASAGLGEHDFDDGRLGDIATYLYDANVVYAPNETLRFTGRLSTSVQPVGPDTAGTAQIVHTASLDAGYTINDWLRLRASAEWSRSKVEGSTEQEDRTTLGTGADYALGAHTAVSADYGYTQRNNSRTGDSDAHSVSLGITIKR